MRRDSEMEIAFYFGLAFALLAVIFYAIATVVAVWVNLARLSGRLSQRR